MAKRKPQPRKSRRPARAAARGEPETLWLYGAHAVLAALGNPRRRLHRLLWTPEAARSFEAEIGQRIRRRNGNLAPISAERAELDHLLPDGAVHQGLALAADPLIQPNLDDLTAAAPPPEGGRHVIVVLDQVTDPQNVGAILRTASAFAAQAAVTTRRNAAPETGALVKAASGAFEHLPYVQETNLARALERLKAAGYWLIGLAAEAEVPLAGLDPGPRVGLVLGAEGGGLRRLTREACDHLVRLPTQGPIGQLNVSNAAAVALYELLGRRA